MEGTRRFAPALTIDLRGQDVGGMWAGC